jgi:glutamyl/glutaminyl-tRNA synthetase
MDPAAVRKHVSVDSGTGAWMPLLVEELERLDAFDAKGVEQMLRGFLKKHRLKPGRLINAVRTVLTGWTVGPEFIDILVCLGRRRVVARLKQVPLRLHDDTEG